MADIHNQSAHLDKSIERGIKKPYPQDQGDAKRFLNDLEAQGYSPARVKKYLYSLVSLKKKMDTPFNEATTEDVKRFVVKLERSNYKPWTKTDI